MLQVNDMFPVLRIDHNHGHAVLKDATVVETYTYDNSKSGGAKFQGAIIKGTVVSGVSTARLFHASHTTHYQPGTEMTWDLYGKQPRKGPGASWVVDMTSCG